MRFFCSMQTICDISKLGKFTSYMYKETILAWPKYLLLYKYYITFQVHTLSYLLLQGRLTSSMFYLQCLPWKHSSQTDI